MKMQRKTVYALLAVALSVTGLALFGISDDTDDLSSSASTSPGSLVAHAQQDGDFDVAQGARPPGVSDDDWARILQIFKTQPGAAKEFRRVTEYMAYEADMRAWEAMRAGGPSVERTAMAKKLLDALPARLANKEVSGAEAMALVNAFVVDLVPDQAEREKRIAFERQKLSQIRDPEEEALVKQEAQRTALFETQSKEIVAMHLSANNGQVNEEKLEAELQAMREKIFSN